MTRGSAPHIGAHPRRIASLYVWRGEGERLLYAGKAQSGYTFDAAQEVRERLDPIIAKKSPLTGPVKKPKATWVEPIVAAEIEYSGITDDGLLRAAVFKGLRDDLGKPPKARVAVKQSGKSVGAPRENILQFLPDAVAPSKEELKAYWIRVAPKAPEHLGRRPLKLVRNVHHTIFYHKGPLPPVPRTGTAARHVALYMRFVRKRWKTTTSCSCKCACGRRAYLTKRDFCGVRAFIPTNA